MIVAGGPFAAGEDALSHSRVTDRALQIASDGMGASDSLGWTVWIVSVCVVRRGTRRRTRRSSTVRSRGDVHTKVTEGRLTRCMPGRSLAVDELLGRLCACTANFALEMQKYAKVC